MKHVGWTWGDLVGELQARGIDPYEIAFGDDVVAHRTVEGAADYIERRLSEIETEEYEAYKKEYEV